MDWISKITNEAKKQIQDQVAKYKNREFLAATVAGCALVAAADGSISAEEKQKMMRYMSLSPELKVFGASEIASAFKPHADLLEFDFQIGKLDAIKTITRLKDKPDEAKVMVRVCCIIGAADGTFDDDEKAVVKEICTALEIDPKEFGL